MIMTPTKTPIKCPRYFSPRTKLRWIPYQSTIIGASSFLYLAPFLYGAWGMWPLQALLSFMSDYVATGRDSWWHVADRCLAATLSVFMICIVLLQAVAAGAIPPWVAVFLVVSSFSCYGVSGRAMARRDFPAYVAAHTAWHVVSSLCNVYVMSNVCEASLEATCASRDAADVALWPAIRPAFRCRCCSGGELAVFAAAFALLTCACSVQFSTTHARLGAEQQGKG
jgi:hypothetical protein